MNVWYWTASVPCVILFIITISEVEGAKGIKGIKIPRPKVPIVPVVVPVVVPVGSRNRYSSNDNNRNRLQCYSCEGKNNDPCSLNPAGPGTQRITCPTNQYCIVLRRETLETPTYNVTVKTNSSLIATLEESTLLTNETVSISSTTIMPQLSGNSTISETSTLNTTSASEEATLSINNSKSNDTATSSTTQSIVNRERRAPENKTQHTVLISRGCQSSDFVQGSLLASSGKRENGTYIQVCKTDLCNSGDGRLKCYECEGSGITDPCATQPASVAKIALCFPDQYCTVVKTTTNSTSASNTTVTAISISRGCKTASNTEDLYNVKLSRRESTNNMKCSTDLCNSESAHKLFETQTSRKNSASGAMFSSVMVGIFGTLSSLLLSSSLKKP